MVILETALCVGDPAPFMDEEPENLAVAKAVCQDCPVIVRCLDWAIKNREEYGVWGGLSWVERQPLLPPIGCRECGAQLPNPQHRRYCDKCRVVVRRNTRDQYDAARRNNIKPLPPDDPRHGTEAGYRHHRCRCQPCTDANSAKWRARNETRKRTRK